MNVKRTLMLLLTMDILDSPWNISRQFVVIPFQWHQPYAFLIGDPLKPGQIYRFRIRTELSETGQDLLPVSRWSEPVSTQHITSAPPPRIKSVQVYVSAVSRSSPHLPLCVSFISSSSPSMASLARRATTHRMGVRRRRQEPSGKPREVWRLRGLQAGLFPGPHASRPQVIV